MVSNKRAPGLLAAVIIACLVAALGFGRQVSTLASAEETGTHTLGTTMDDGTVVTIEAQADVLPQGTTVEARLVDDQKVIDAVNGKLQDGGNSATLVFHNEIYSAKENKERSVSDIIYFASAIGE